jgi:hypothetical protein
VLPPGIPAHVNRGLRAIALSADGSAPLMFQSRWRTRRADSCRGRHVRVWTLDTGPACCWPISLRNSTNRELPARQCKEPLQRSDSKVSELACSPTTGCWCSSAFGNDQADVIALAADCASGTSTRWRRRVPRSRS